MAELDVREKARAAARLSRIFTVRRSSRENHDLILGSPRDLQILATRYDRLAKTIRLSNRVASWPEGSASRTRLRENLEVQVRDLFQATRRVFDFHHARSSMGDVQNTRETTFESLFGEIGLLQADYHDVRVDFSKRELSVTTPDILCEGINFGPFEILVGWAGEGEENDFDNPHYHVRAFPKNPRYNLLRDYFHPHVDSNGHVCHGSTLSAVILALKQGRLYDVIDLTHSVLQYYNSSSPYARIDSWVPDEREGLPLTRTRQEGETAEEEFQIELGAIIVPYSASLASRATCQRCGETREGNSCEFCNGTYCSSCVFDCPCCSRKCCLGCSAGYRHPVTHESVRICSSRSCRSDCGACGTRVAGIHYNLDTRQCLGCQERENLRREQQATAAGTRPEETRTPGEETNATAGFGYIDSDDESSDESEYNDHSDDPAEILPDWDVFGAV